MPVTALPQTSAASPPSPGIRGWLFRTVFTNLCGVTFRDWWQILRENHFAVDARYWPRAAVQTLGSVLNSHYRRLEDRDFGENIDAAVIQPPVFILGHWRSGTTLLHNLLSLDDQFAYPNLYEVFFPHTFLGTETLRAGLAGALVPETRILDNVAQRFDTPNEDEFATAAMSLRSPYMGWAFPRRQAHYDRYLTFRDVPQSEVDEWKRALVLFLKKLSCKFNRPILLKSPPHTCRIRLLRELFPDARFVHIHRDPYTVFQSTRHLFKVLTRALQFQQPRGASLDSMILERYRTMHEVYFAEQPAIPDGHFHELAFHDLERDPVGQIRDLYDALGLKGFDAVLPRLEEHVDQLSGYRKNRYSELEAPLRRRIATSWQQSFDAWGYPTD